MSLTMYSHGHPRQSPEKARPSPCLKADAPAGHGKFVEAGSLTPNVSANLFRFAFVLYRPVLLVDVVNVLVCVHAGGPFPVRLGKLRRFRRAAAHFKCSDSSFEVAGRRSCCS